MIHRFWFCSLFFVGLGQVFGQNFPQQTPAHIQSVFFEVAGQMDPFPILEANEIATLHFDDLQAQETDYFYTIRYFDHDWTPSLLFENEYLQGLAQNRVSEFTNAVNTLQPYTHYTIQIPNEECKPLLSGNYLIEVEDIDGNIIFSRPFAIAQNRVSVAGGVYRSVDLEKFQTHQRLQLSIRALDRPIRQPEERLHVYIVQNKRWDKIQGPIPIHFNRGMQIDFRLDPSLSFNGENEFLFVDTKDVRVPGPQTAFVEREDLYIAHLHPDPFLAQSPYTWTGDINGRFMITTLQDYGYRHHIADYSWVHFSYIAPPPNTNDRIYVLGHFNAFQPAPAYEMLYNPDSSTYEAYVRLKQGLYNYQYFLQNDLSPDRITPLSGQHAQTENEYTVLVYYKGFGDLNDALIAVQSFSSFDLLN